MSRWMLILLAVLAERPAARGLGTEVSEEALAVMTAGRLGGRPNQRWLVGGYGMGFTLRAARAAAPADADLTVAELVPEIE